MPRIAVALSILIVAVCGHGAISWSTVSNEVAPWTQFQEMHGCVILNGFIYSIGGRIGSGNPPQGTGAAASDTFSVYCARILSPGVTSEWTTCTALLPPGSPTAAHPDYAHIARQVSSYNGRIYITGGNTNGPDPERNAVTYAQPLPNGDITAWTLQPAAGNSIGRFEHASLIDPATGKLYVIGGGSSVPRVRQIDMAQINPDGSVGVFVTAGTLATGVGSAPVVLLNGRIYVVGGNKGNEATAEVQHAPILPGGTLGTFVSNGALIPEARYDGGAVAIAGAIYAIGGTLNSQNSSTRNTVFRTVPDSNGAIVSWTTDTSLPVTPGMRRMTVGTDSTGIYIPGGRLNDTVLSRQLIFGTLASSVEEWRLQ